LSALHKMQSDSGSLTERNRHCPPFHPNEMVCRCCKSFIGDDLSFSTIHKSFMRYPILSIPYLMVQLNLLDGHQSLIRQDELPFCDTAQSRLLPLLPVFVVGMPLDDGLLRDVEHATGRRLVDFAL